MSDRDFYNGQPKPTEVAQFAHQQAIFFIARKYCEDAQALRVTVDDDGLNPDLQRCVNGQWRGWVTL